MSYPNIPLSARPGPLADVDADWLVVPVWEGEAPSGELAALDGKLGGDLARLREVADLTGKALELVALLTPKGVAAKRVMLVGLGKKKDADRAGLRDAAAAAVKEITGKKVGRIAFALPEGVPSLSAEEAFLAAAAGLYQGAYGPGIRKTEPPRFAPGEFVIACPPGTKPEQVEPALRRAAIEGRAVALARWLVNLPPCELYPETFAQQVKAIAGEWSIDCEVLDEAQLMAERMGSMLGVARGSDRPPRLVVLRYMKGGSGPTLGLVGKGVTFDSGGLSLKDSDQMADMKCDMAGAAAVLAAVQAIAELGLAVNVVGVTPLVENMPGGKALKLGDVLKARNGKTIEVMNTDAEGRLILADALAYAVDQKANHLVDLATLTGSCMVALGTEVAGLMSNNDEWGERVRAAIRRAGERAWPLPMDSSYDSMLKSDVADLKNIPPNRYGGAIAGGKFLEQFVAGLPWVHLDIAGPAWADSESTTRDAGGTGAYVRSLVELAAGYGG